VRLPNVEELRREVGRTLFDRRLGISTTDRVPVRALDHPNAAYHEYSPAPWRALYRALAPSEASKDEAFADVGSGLGRVVMRAAARYRFRRVIGVEVSEELHRRAQQNVQAFRGHLRTPEIELVHADALEWPLPEDLGVVFLFNPFGGDVLEQFAARLAAWSDRTGRTLRIVYQNPTEEAVLTASGRVRLLRSVSPSLRRRRASDVVSVYELVPRP
jgi:precorrin-6B methylase 2